MKFSKRRATALVGVALASALALAGCSGFGGGSGSGGDSASGNLTFTTWASKSEEASFKKLVKQFESEHKGATVKLNVVPYEQMFSNIDAQLSSGDAPDVFRVDYGNLGVYSSQDQLLDLSSYFSKSEISAFQPAMWQAVSYDGKPYGVPHQTDVSALLVNLDMLKQAGIDTSTLPKTQKDAWTWDQFADVAAKLRASLPADKYPFVYNWQQAGAARWLSWLFQANGKLIDADGKTPAIDSAAGTKALDFTKSFFEKQWVPPTSSVKSSTYADSLFSEGTAAMGFLGSFLVPDMANLAKFDWTAIPMPKDERGATDLGGNALVATKATKNPKLAAEFLKFMVQADSMSAFCAATNELPTRTDLGGDKIAYAVRPDVMPAFVDQATTIEPSDVKQLTSPAMSAINTALQDQLDAAFIGGQSTKDTLAKLSDAVKEATK
ncbi:ABC transporter substrate-binding protein [Leifsonia sp. NPDC014704]|uniref:Sugar ABC transporter substrate-binding protein n=1 Tax=Leifsonia virtsii TaxID=3035915 RepID=A0ABT8J2P8_9MICO|nr:sugar ABC transporter substrate-binding protein [Leifsonia virtsii]MDN4599361.1 sugar ABC transporter substrate-binding protein [Leifsonia virtsii]